MHCSLPDVWVFERGRPSSCFPRFQRPRRTLLLRSQRWAAGLEAAVVQVHPVPTSGQEEEAFVLKEIDPFQESGRVKRIVASQRVLELHGLFEESLRSFFLERWNSFQEACLELRIMQSAIGFYKDQQMIGNDALDIAEVKSALHESRESDGRRRPFYLWFWNCQQSVLSPFSGSDGLSSDTLKSSWSCREIYL
jgi:hypothetical protein